MYVFDNITYKPYLESNLPTAYFSSMREDNYVQTYSWFLKLDTQFR